MAHLCYILDTSRDFYFPGMYNKKFTCSARLALNQLCTFSTRAGILCQNFEIGTLSPPLTRPGILCRVSPPRTYSPQETFQPRSQDSLTLPWFSLAFRLNISALKTMRMGRPYHTKIFFKCKTFDLGKWESDKRKQGERGEAGETVHQDARFHLPLL